MSVLRATAACIHRGATVGVAYRVPDEAWERWSVGPEIGCNRLVCGRCGQAVRQQAGVGLDPSGPSPSTASLHAASDWSRVPGVRMGGASRLYACACTSHVESTHGWMEHQGRDPLAPDRPWSCAGHPAPVWPLTLLGGVLDEASDVEALTRDALAGRRSPPSDAPVEKHRGWGLEPLVDAVPGWADRVFSTAIASLIDDAAPTVRRALDLLRHHPDRVPHEDAVARWRRLTTLEDPWVRGRTLGVVFSDALAARVRQEGSGSAAEVAGRELLQAGCEGRQLAFALR